MAEQQQTAIKFEGMSLDKIIEAMTADLESSNEHYTQFHGTSSQLPRAAPTWENYSLNHTRNYSSNSAIHTQNMSMPSMAPLSSSIYMQDAAYETNNAQDCVYFGTEPVNHLGMNHSNELIRAIDVGGGNYINVIYSNSPQIVNEPANLTPYNNCQEIIDRDYGPFNDQRILVQHNNVTPSTNGKQLIENLVGNWVPNQSGTYSPFGGSPNVTPSVSSPTEIHTPRGELPKVLPDFQQQQQQQLQRKPRMVAEVKPMRPSYSAVLTKSAPAPSSPLNIAPTKIPSADTGLKKTSGKVSKCKTKSGLLKRQNSTGSDDHGSPKIQVPKKSMEKNNSNLRRRWVSLDNLEVQSDSHEMNTFNKSDQFEKRKSTKISKKNDKTETVSNNKIQNGNIKTSGNVQRRSIQINNNLNNNSCTLTAEKIEKNPQTNYKVTKDEKKIIKEKNSKRFYPEKAQQIKKNQKNRKRDNREAPMKELCRNINKHASRWCKIGFKVFLWLLHLISDVMSMSMNLVVQFIKCIWFHTVLYVKNTWSHVAMSFSKIRILNIIGKKIDGWFGNSRFAFWRRIKTKKSEKEENTVWMHGGLETNIALPSTGEEAMKRLLACKGKDPYSILGVTPMCSDDDIKKYYKRQAFLVHPDKNSQPGAEEAFKILVHAFDMIGEPERRQAFDQTRQVEAAWGELSDLLSQLHRKMEQAANTIRCTNCGSRHKRIPTQRPCYAARFCAQCKIRHSAKEGDIWAESRVMGFLWHYYACMEGAVYDVTDWAACQAANLKHLRANTHSVQYRIVLGQRPSTQTSSSSKKRQQMDPNAIDADLEDFLNNLYSHGKPGPSSSATTTDQASKNDNRRRKPRRK